MTVVRTVIIAALLFVGGFTLALEGWLERTTERETILLRQELEDAIVARDLARDNYDAAVYQVLFQRAAPEVAIAARQSRPQPAPEPTVVTWADLTTAEPDSSRGRDFTPVTMTKP